MTTMIEEEVECCVCGRKSNHVGIGSTNSFGSPDLDTRAPRMLRSAINQWIQRCPSCGYCSPDLSECGDRTKEIVNSKEYQNIVGNAAMPKVVTSFLALSFEKEKRNEYSESAWQAIHAAWICDDKGEVELSIECRKKAIMLVKKAKAHGQKIADQAGASEAITIDLMRRSHMFNEALVVAEEVKAKEIGGIIARVIEFQEELISKKDIAAHRISEALS